MVERGVGAVGRTPAATIGGRCGSAATACWKPRPFAVAVLGATIVTLRTFVMLVTLFVTLWLLFSTLPFTRMPTLITGGAPMTTDGGVPIGAGTMMPGRDPGGGGMNTPCGPSAWCPAWMPTATTAATIAMPIAGAMKWRSGGDQYAGTYTTLSSRCS